ncbi:MAG: hypothetical protein QM820_28295 [Minicystis sp.]
MGPKVLAIPRGSGGQKVSAPGRSSSRKLPILAAHLVGRQLAREAGEDARRHPHLAVLADREGEVVDRILGLALLDHAHLDVEEGAGDVERAQPVDELAGPVFRGLFEVERLLQIAGVEGAVAVERGHEARARVEVDVEEARLALVLQLVAHRGAEEAVLLEPLGHLAIGVAQGGLVDARARAHAVGLLEIADLAIEGRLDDEDALLHRPRLAGDDVDGEHHLVGLIGVGRVGPHRREGEAVLLVVVAHPRGDVGELRRRHLAAHGDARGLQHLALIERAALDLDGRDQAAGQHVDAQDDAAFLGVHLHVGAPDLRRGQHLAHDPPRRLRRGGLARAHARDRGRGRPAAADGDHLDAADWLAHELGRGDLGEIGGAGAEAGVLAREERLGPRRVGRRRRSVGPQRDRRDRAREDRQQGAEETAGGTDQGRIDAESLKDGGGPARRQGARRLPCSFRRFQPGSTFSPPPARGATGPRRRVLGGIHE